MRLSRQRVRRATSLFSTRRIEPTTCSNVGVTTSWICMAAMLAATAANAPSRSCNRSGKALRSCCAVYAEVRSGAR
jgi:hypothetical protein